MTSVRFTIFCLLAILATGGPCAGGPSAQACDDDTLPPERLEWIKSLKPGDAVTLGQKGEKNVLGSSDVFSHRRLVELLAASDETGINELLTNKRCWLLTPGSAARVIKVGRDYIEVREKDGAKRAIYVHFTWIRSVGGK